MMTSDPTPVPSAQMLTDQILHHLTHTQGRGPEFATIFDWRLAVSYTTVSYTHLRAHET